MRYSGLPVNAISAKLSTTLRERAFLINLLLNYLVEETNNSSSQMSLSGFDVVHDSVVGGQDDETKLS